MVSSIHLFIRFAWSDDARVTILSSIPPSSLVWFKLLNSATALPYKDTSLPTCADIADFRDAVKAKNASILSEISSSQLLVYKNKTSFDKRNAAVQQEKEKPLKEDYLIDGIGSSKKEALVVVVPPPTRYLQGVPIHAPFSRSNRQINIMAGGMGKTTQIYNTQNLMDVNSSLKSDSELSSCLTFEDEIFETDAIDMNLEHLERHDLLSHLGRLVAKHRFVRLTSPSASGKSSLLKMYQYHIRNHAEVVWIKCLDTRSCIQLLWDKAGIDFVNESIANGVGDKNLIVFLDDAQAKYEDQSFWKLLIKTAPAWLPSTVRFVISSTHLLDGGFPEMFPLQRLERKDFLNSNESKTLLELPITGLPKFMRFPSLIQFLIGECGGLIGALRISVQVLKRQFPNNNAVPQSALFQYCLSKEYLIQMSRCFGSAHTKPTGDNFKNFLIKIFLNKKTVLPQLLDEMDMKSLLSLKKSGILLELPDATYEFTSRLAKRYYFQWIFPNRSETAPTSLHELVQNVIRSMSSNLLKQSTVAGDFPKEAVFQHLFMNGLALHTTADCLICPELAKIFPGTKSSESGTVPGEIDFFLNGDLHWGIELLINGSGIGEHLSRFESNGKYSHFGLKDFVVVDFQSSKSGKPTDIKRYANQITVFVKEGTFDSVQCLFGYEDAVQINLEK